jgi:hypothetical protein
MNGKGSYAPYVTRLLVITLVSLLGVVAVNEGAYLFQKEDTDRAPRSVQLVIPAGTSERVAAGEPSPSIPEKIVFVAGDVLEVVNQDSVPHQLGPVWVPPGATGRLDLGEANKYSYTCSFSTDRFLGLDVRTPTTLGTRIAGAMIATPPTIAFLFLYSLLVFPVKPEPKKVGNPA